MLSRTSLRGAIAAATLSVLSACSIEEPALPSLESEFLLPIGSIVAEVQELVEDEDGLQVQDDGVLAFLAEGELDSVEIGDELDIELEGQSFTAAIGDIELDPQSDVHFDFRLGTIYPPAVALDGFTIAVPGFVFDLRAPAQDLPGFTQAAVLSGAILVSLGNGLSVPVGGNAAPEAIEIALVDPETDATLVATTVNQEIPPGASRELSLDLAGVSLPDSILVSLRGGSPGSGGSAVPVDADATISIDASTSPLTVAAARAPVEAQSFADSTIISLPDSVRVQTATIAQGTLSISARNDLQIPLHAILRVDRLRDPTDQPLLLSFLMAGSSSTTRSVDLQDYRLDFGGALGEELSVVSSISSPGSDGYSVWIHSTDVVDVSIDPLNLQFASVTGTLAAQRLTLDETTLEIEIPEDLQRVSLAQAELEITLDSTADLPGTIELELEGTSSEGGMVPLTLQLDLPFEIPLKSNTIVIDETNQQVLPFLNNFPTQIVARGSAEIGDGVTVGTARIGDSIRASYRILAPLRVSVEPQEIELESEAIELEEDLRDELRERLREAVIMAQVSSTLPVEAEAYLHLDPDPDRVENDARIVLGPIYLPAAGEPLAGQTRDAVRSESQVILTAAQVPLLTEQTLHRFVRLVLPGTNGEIITLRATDAVELSGFVKARVRLGD